MLMPASAMPRSRSCSFHAKRTYARTTFRPQGGARARTALARVVHSVFPGVPGLSAGPPCHHAAKTGANISYRLMSAVVRRARFPASLHPVITVGALITFLLLSGVAVTALGALLTALLAVYILLVQVFGVSIELHPMGAR